jgi:putative phosphonate metabolism protein
MTTTAPRYAIYVVPRADTALYRFGASVLGYDCYSGRDVAPIASTESFVWPEIVREPRLYGFHATLKAPFRLAEGVSEADLGQAFGNQIAGITPVLVGDLVLHEIGAFIALAPKAKCPALDRLAATCVQAFDRFRAPMTDAERARRLASNLSARQIEHLDRWGYPYVFEEFRFHMTLTGPLALSERARAFAFLCEKFEQSPAARSLIVDQIVIARQAAANSPFKVLRAGALGSPFIALTPDPIDAPRL